MNGSRWLLMVDATRPERSGYVRYDSTEAEALDAVVRGELDLIMPQIAMVLASAADARSCAIYVYDEAVQRTVAAFRHGFEEMEFPELFDAAALPPKSVPIEAEVMRTGLAIRRTTEEDFRRWPMLNPALRNENEHYSDMVLPLVWHENVCGAAYLWKCGDPRGFDDGQVSIAEDLAQIAAMAVVFARQYGQERTQRKQLDALLEVATLAASPTTIDDVLPHLTHAVRSATGSDVCLLYVMDDSGDRVVAGYSDGLNRREQWVFDSSFTYPVSSVPVEERVRRTLEPSLVVDMEADLAPGSELVIYATEVGLKEMLITPIVYQQSMIGVVYSWHRDGNRRYDRNAIATIQAIANQAGGVISRARLHEESQQHIQETDALLRIGQAVLTSDSLDVVLDEIAEALSETIPYDYAFVGMLNGDETAIRVIRHWGSFPGSILHQELPLDGSLTGSAVASGSILNVADAFSDERTLRFDPQYVPIRSVLIAPLVTERGRIGALYLGRHKAGYFAPRQERMMGLLAQQAAIAIERVQARQSLAVRTQRQTFLATVVDRLVAEDDVMAALPGIARAACGVLADGVVLGVSSWKRGVVDWVVADHRVPDARSHLQRLLEVLESVDERDAVEQLLQSSEVTRASAEQVIRQVPEIAPMLLDGNVTEMMVVPLFQPGRARGLMLLLSSAQESSFDAEVAELAKVVASRVGDALERKQMSLNRVALLRASEALNSKMELTQILDVFTQELQTIVPFEQLYLSTLKEGGEEREAILVNTPWVRTREPFPVPVDLGLTGVALTTGEPVFENQAHVRPESFYPNEEERRFYMQHGESGMAAPLIAEGAVIGSLFIGRAGSNRFSRSDFETFLLFAELAASAIHRTTLVQENNRVYRASVEVLAAVVDAKDPTTLEHSRNVAHYSRHAAGLMELPAEEIERIELAGLMHDIGKLGIPDRILSKPGRLSPAERALINEHPSRGANILGQHPALTGLVPLVRYHHEWYDGNGYPDGLSGAEIPIGASIIAVADAFDTMISERTYQARRSVEQALDELERCAGSQFHPQVVDRFIRSVRENPHIVRHRSSRGIPGKAEPR